MDGRISDSLDDAENAAEFMDVARAGGNEVIAQIIRADSDFDASLYPLRDGEKGTTESDDTRGNVDADPCSDEGGVSGLTFRRRKACDGDAMRDRSTAVAMEDFNYAG